MVNALSSDRPKSPFQSQKEKTSRKRRREAYPGTSSLRQDRGMSHYIRMLRSGLCELAIICTVESKHHASVTVGLLRVLRECLADSFERSELPALQRRVRMALKAFFDTYPHAFATITMHMIMHLSDTIARYGPLKCSWTMWGERFI